MECWGNYCYIPWPVEVAVESAATGWSTWLPFAGSVLLFVASMITLAKTIRSSDRRAEADRRAAQERANADRDAAQDRANADREAAHQRAEADREAARRRSVREREAARKLAQADRAEQRDRDFRNWQRDTLLRISSEAIEAAMNAQDDYNRLAFGPQMTMESADLIEQAARKIGVCGLTLRLVGAHEAADRCRDIRSTIASRELLGVLLKFNRIHRRSLDEKDTTEGLKEELSASRTQLDQALEVFNSVRARLGETVEKELRSLSQATETSSNDDHLTE